MKAIKVNQAELTSDCWLIQIQGLEACENCELKGTPDCGGKNIIKRIGEGKYPTTGIGRCI
jgi:hypothetical protein